MCNIDLKLSSYNYHLPSELIASRPDPDRHNSRLLIYRESDGAIFHETFKNIGKYLPEKTTLVFNQSEVIKCRVDAKKRTGGKAEVFFLGLIETDGLYNVLIKSNSRKKIGDCFFFKNDDFVKIEKITENGDLYVSLNSKNLEGLLNECGQIPIPPYIRKGISDEQDEVSYQTVYAKDKGSVAAPTAGLHFSKELLKNLKSNGITDSYVTLHVGIGTFRPVSTENLNDHKMHTEKYFYTKENLEKIQNAKNLFAVGTTSLRALESRLNNNRIEADADTLYETDIFLYPGKKVKSIKGLITNFHLPESSLLMLVSSLIGRKKTLELYNIAIENKYRFFSYGDSMLILRDN